MAERTIAQAGAVKSPPNLLYTVAELVNDLAAAMNALTSDGVAAVGTLAISAGDATKFKTTTTAYYRIAGVQYSKAATDSLTFSAADTVNAGADTGSFWGAWLVQINAAGTISTKSVAADQVFESEAEAIAALPAPAANNVAIGYITVNANNDSAWTANTDDLTPASDVADANFYDADLLGLTDTIDTIRFRESAAAP